MSKKSELNSMMEKKYTHFEDVQHSTGDSAAPRLKVVYSTLEWISRSTVWRPPTDVLETEVSILVKVEVAGMQAGEFTLSVQPHLLAIRGMRNATEQRGAYHQMEINSGEFVSVVELARAVDPDSVQATYKDGFLVIMLAKSRGQDR